MKNEEIIDKLEIIIKKKMKHKIIYSNFFFEMSNTAYFNVNNELIGIYISSPNFYEFPGGFFELKTLRYLKIYKCPIKAIPSDIKKLNLEILDISLTNIKIIPKFLFLMKTLVELTIGSNIFDEFPNEVFRNSISLKSLTLYINPTIPIDDYIKKINFPNFSQRTIENLVLSADSRLITVILQKFQNLKRLKLEHDYNFFENLDLRNFVNLKYLDLDHNNIKKIPESISQLKQLEELCLSYNNINELPEEFGKLIKLKMLNLEYNQIITLPESIGNNSSLVGLYFQYNKIERLPESIGKLSLLKYFNLQDNQLTYLPNSIKNLKNLEVLTLYNNNLHYIPSDFNSESCPNLKMIQIEEKFFDLFVGFMGKGVLIDEFSNENLL